MTTKISYPPSIEGSEFGFTRYLYVIDDVKSSLVMALLDRNLDEALFWGYELYFSGFQEIVLGLLHLMVESMYSTLNPHLDKFLKKKKAEWDENKTYATVGTFIYNMIGRPYDITSFVIDYCNDAKLAEIIGQNAGNGISKKSFSKIFIVIEPKDVKKYITVNHAKPHYLLRCVVKYQVRKNTLAIFDHEHGIYTHAQLQSLYWYRWLYYACSSPIWLDRVTKYGGVLNHEHRRIDFATYEQDEEFHNKYNLEPDEQPQSIQNMNIGIGTEDQISWQEFYEKYAIGKTSE